MTDIFLKIVNMSISAGWIVLAVLLLRLLLKKAPKWVNVLLWGVVAVRLIFPFSVESVLSLIPSAETVSPDIMLSPSPAINTGIPAVNQSVNPVIGSAFAPEPFDSANPLQIWIPILAAVWLFGVALMLLYAAFSYLSVKRKVGAAVRLRDNIYESENVMSPFVLGTIRPKIYLPFQLSERNISHVIAHEEAHIRRRDHLWKPLGFLLLSVYWFNPLLWLGYGLLCRDIEGACDEKVVKTLDHDARADYSEALLLCSVNRRLISACPLAFGETGVKSRIKSVLNYKKPAFWIIVVAVVALIAVAVCFLTNPKTPEDEGVRRELTLEDVIQLSKKGEKLTRADLDKYSYNGASAYDYKYFLYEIDECFELMFNGGDDEDPLTVRLKGRTSNGEVRFIDVLHEDVETFVRRIRAVQPLTLEGVIELSKKGEALTEDDFQKYMYDVTGVGQSIRPFQIDDVFSLSVGRDPGKDGLAYVLLQAEGGGSIDIRYDNVEAFIKERTSGTLTLEDVIRLAGKGDDLSWSDFKRFDHINIGPGLYYVTYPIDENFSLLLGGKNTEKKPDYILLQNSAGITIDIRYEDVGAFVKGLSVRRLTLEDVIELSKKGDALTWADFSGYDHENAGSGLHYEIYPIDETFSLLLGGGTPYGEISHAQLQARGQDGTWTSIDIRYEDVAAFIRENASKIAES